ncbi:MAG: FkbM family methyltransferase [Isosphaeraceae bacterium]
MKRMLVGTRLGRIAMSAREAMQLVREVYVKPESVGTLANDQLATTLVTSICAPGKTFVDVGAHIGSIVAEVLRNDPSVRVIAIEAIPEKAAGLRRKFPSIEVHDCAVGETEGQITFYVDTERSGYSSLVRPAAGDRSATREITVPIRRLDGLVSASGVDVIKIDVEGAELAVLKGGENLIARDRPLILFESGPPRSEEVDFRGEMWDWLASRDYAVLIPNRVAHIDPGLGREGFLESHLYPRRTTNYFAIPRERREQVRHHAFKLLGLGAG